MANIYLPVSALIVSFVLLFVYCSKEKAKIKENNIYLCMLICIFLDSVFVSAIYFLFGKHEPLIKFFNRCDYVTLVVWSGSLCLYAHTVIHKKDEVLKGIAKFSRISIISLICIQCILVWILGLNAVSEDGIVVAIVGPVVYFTLGSCCVNILLSLIVIICNIRKAAKQIIPVFIGLAIAGICALAYYIDPTISGVSMGFAIVNLTMYFTIENPDVQMLNKVKLAKEEALRANQAKTDFLSSMSHEIRTPLNAIVSLAECIQNDTNLDETKKDAKDIISASENLLEIINGILDISKIEAGKMEIVNKEYDLTDVSEKLSKLIKARIGEKPIELRTTFSEKIPGVLFGDEGKVRQIMTNLLTNAVKYTDSGHIDFIIDCINSNNTANLTITVSDTGQGVKPEVIETMFEKFNRLDEVKNSNIEGTGLGLAITKEFVEMLGGTIEVQSTYGEGTTFIFKISQEIRSVEHRVSETVVEIQNEYPGRKVLVVDDTAINLMVAKRILGLYKLDVDTASSGEECILKCKEQTYDLVLLDEMMPKMSGLETLGILKTLPSFDIPVVACTANAIEGMRDKYISSGYTDYLSKPIIKGELLQIIDKYLA